MQNKYLGSLWDYVRLVLVIVVMGLLAVFVVTGDSIPWFLMSSAAIVVLSVTNYVALRESTWSRFALLMSIGMVLGFVGDLLMAGIFYITPIEILNGVMLFGLGHAVYLLGLRDRSPLLLKPESGNGGRLIVRNLLIWVVSTAAVLVLFFLTVYNPSMMELSVGMLGYGILLVTVLAFALTKWFDDYSLGFRLLICVGFAFFLFSDWLIGYHEMTNPSFLSGPWVGITYIFAQLSIHLAVLLISKNE